MSFNANFTVDGLTPSLKSNPTGNATSAAVTTLFTTVNVVVNVPVTFVTPFFGVIVNVPFPGAALFVVS